MKAKYKILGDDDLNIFIEDLDKGRTITNDAQNVIQDLDKKLSGGIGKRRVYYTVCCQLPKHGFVQSPIFTSNKRGSCSICGLVSRSLR